MKGFTQRLVLKQRHKDTFIHELLTGAFDLLSELLYCPLTFNFYLNSQFYCNHSCCFYY